MCILFFLSFPPFSAARVFSTFHRFFIVYFDFLASFSLFFHYDTSFVFLFLRIHEHVHILHPSHARTYLVHVFFFRVPFAQIAKEKYTLSS